MTFVNYYLQITLTIIYGIIICIMNNTATVHKYVIRYYVKKNQIEIGSI